MKKVKCPLNCKYYSLIYLLMYLWKGCNYAINYEKIEYCKGN